jgi:cytochrome P450
MQVFPAQKPHPASQKPPRIKFASLVERLRAIFKSNVAASAFEFNALALDSELGICRLCTPAGTFTALTDPDLVEEMMTRGEFDKEPDLSKIFAEVRLTADDGDPEWGIAHRILAKPFSRQGMASFVPLMNEQADLMVAALERHVGFGGTTGMDEWSAKLAFETIA